MSPERPDIRLCPEDPVQPLGDVELLRWRTRRYYPRFLPSVVKTCKLAAVLERMCRLRDLAPQPGVDEDTNLPLLVVSRFRRLRFTVDEPRRLPLANDVWASSWISM